MRLSPLLSGRGRGGVRSQNDGVGDLHDLVDGKLGCVRVVRTASGLTASYTQMEPMVPSVSSITYPCAHVTIPESRAASTLARATASNASGCVRQARRRTTTYVSTGPS